MQTILRAATRRTWSFGLLLVEQPSYLTYHDTMDKNLNDTRMQLQKQVRANKEA